jgi:hypothetical protein
LSKYRIEEVTDLERWDKLVEDSPQGTIFSLSTYLNSFGGRYEIFFVFKGEELRGGVALVVDKKSAILDDFIIYNGLLFNKPTNKQNRSQQISEQFRVSEFVAEELLNRYENLEIALHPIIVDIRSFLWINYGKENLPKYTPDVRYTSYLDISDFDKKLENRGAFQNSSTARRQEIRYGIKKGVETIESQDLNLFVDFYKSTISEDEIIEKGEKVEHLQNLLKALLENSMGKMFFSKTADGDIGSSAFFGIDNKRAYYLFGANEPKLRNKHTGTAVLWSAFETLKNIGVSEVDLEGINSPHRGWFKSSFGGDIRTYYEIRKTVI